MRFLKIYISLIILLLIVNNNVFAQKADSTWQATYRFENGTVSSEGTLRNGKPDGYWKSFYMNGNLKTEGNRKDFLLDGVWKFYTEEGLLYLSINYKDDKKDGQRISYQGTQPYKIELFVQDLKQGQTKEFFADGTLKKVTPFTDGREKGQGYEYDSTGLVIALQTYKAGVLVKEQQINRRDGQGLKKGIWMTFHENDATQTEGIYVNDLKHGYWKYYKPDGNLIRLEKWIHGVLVEDATDIAKIDVRREIDRQTGKTKSIGGYRNGQKEGVHRDYDNDGNVIGSRLYSNGVVLAEGIYDEQGRRQGIWKYFRETGEVKETGRFKDDKRVGTWKYYFENGEVEQIGDFANDKPQGTWRWYYENKQLRLEEEYENGFEEGVSTEYSDSGSVIAVGKYVEGFKDGKWMYTIANLKEEGNYLEGEKQGAWKQTYLDNKKLAFEGEYLNGVPNGNFKYYYASGAIKRRGYYQLGLRQGIWEFFEENGESRLTIKYENGKEIEYNGVKITYGKRADRELEAEEQSEEVQQ